ncbi:hypothetical protein JNK13_10595 [bacterium]|nr:hypothetical protein [bacterium]
MLKRTIIFFAFSTLCALLFPYQIFSKQLEARLKSALEQTNGVVQISGLSFNAPWNVEFEQISIMLPAKPLNIPIVLTEVQIQTSLLALVRGLHQMNFSAQAYQGTIRLSCSRGVMALGKLECSGNANSVSLQAHPLLSLIGLSGKVDVTSNLIGNLQRPGSWEVQTNLNLNDGSVYQPAYLKPTLGVDRISEIKLESNLDYLDSKLELSQAKLWSSIGKAVAKGSIVPSSNIKGIFEPANEYRYKLDSYLRLAANLPVEDSAKPYNQWIFSLISDTLGRATLAFSPKDE